MIAFGVAGGLEAGKAMIDECRLCTRAVSLGGVETLIEHPASMTHATVPVDRQPEAGIDPGGIRLSLGLEPPEDIRADLERALSSVG